MKETKQALKEIANIIAADAGPGVGFALFLDADGRPYYLSNAERPDVVRALEEWLSLSSGDLRVTKAREPTDANDARLALERKCAEIGKELAEEARLILFLFDFGDGGHIAHFTTEPSFREMVARWVKQQRSIS